MQRLKVEKKDPDRLPMAAADALAFVMSGCQIDYEALARIGDAISGEPVAADTTLANRVNTSK